MHEETLMREIKRREEGWCWGRSRVGERRGRRGERRMGRGEEMK